LFTKSWGVFAGSVILLTQSVVYYGISRKEVIPKNPAWQTFPTEIRGWRMQDELPIDKEALDRLRPDDYVNRSYSAPDDRAISSMFVGYFRSQRDGRAPHSPQNCLPGAGWQSVSNRVETIHVSGAQQPVHINEYLVQRDREKLVVHYWFQQNNRVFTNEIVAQFYAIPDLLVHGRTDIAIVRLITPVTSSVALASSEGLQFASDIFPLVQSRLR
jgi:EpsI family protein